MTIWEKNINLSVKVLVILKPICKSHTRSTFSLGSAFQHNHCISSSATPLFKLNHCISSPVQRHHSSTITAFPLVWRHHSSTVLYFLQCNSSCSHQEYAAFFSQITFLDLTPVRVISSAQPFIPWKGHFLNRIFISKL